MATKNVTRDQGKAEGDVCIVYNGDIAVMTRPNECCIRHASQ